MELAGSIAQTKENAAAPTIIETFQATAKYGSWTYPIRFTHIVRITPTTDQTATRFQSDLSSPMWPQALWEREIGKYETMKVSDFHGLDSISPAV
ncbi:MAG: hypothetical protein OXG90_04930, partial [Gammaproteobacteria bacterium]|nr:hypothetical protein [Gammaproteobacteria bacterium]